MAGSSTFLFLFSTTGTAMARLRNSSRSLSKAEFIVMTFLRSAKYCKFDFSLRLKLKLGNLIRHVVIVGHSQEEGEVNNVQ